ncbi:hypothetical protein BGZ60DRAFT_409339 [Tricladium varicosporioides]|nr:hypothetical protein BGZ60DRAFT_409339 [Hymenoscyphus varicosporioides]
MTLCFLEAFRQKKAGVITEEEYINHLLAHCEGVEHEGDDWQNTDYELLKADPFGYSVQLWALKMESIKDAKPFKEVFAAYRTGDIPEIKAKLDKLNEEHAGYARESLAMLALQDRRSKVLKFCFDEGFTFHGFFIDASNEFQNANNDPDTFKVLEESKMRELYPRCPPSVEDNKPPEKDFDEGGDYEVSW